jgi:Carbonic anhydrase
MEIIDVHEMRCDAPVTARFADDRDGDNRRRHAPAAANFCTIADAGAECDKPRRRAQAPARRQRALRRQLADKQGLLGRPCRPRGRAVPLRQHRELRGFPRCSRAAFDQGPGDLFVVRVAGNFVNEDGLASLEYGSLVLGVPLIMVLGHSNCGAVNATIKAVKDGTTLPGHLPSLINAIRPAVLAAQAKNPADLLAEATAENVRLSVKTLLTAKPILSDLVSAGKLKVVGAVYDIATGKVTAV